MAEQRRIAASGRTVRKTLWPLISARRAPISIYGGRRGEVPARRPPLRLILPRGPRSGFDIPARPSRACCGPFSRGALNLGLAREPAPGHVTDEEGAFAPRTDADAPGRRVEWLSAQHGVDSFVVRGKEHLDQVVAEHVEDSHGSGRTKGRGTCRSPRPDRLDRRRGKWRAGNAWGAYCGTTTGRRHGSVHAKSRDCVGPTRRRRPEDARMPFTRPPFSAGVNIIGGFLFQSDP